MNNAFKRVAALCLATPALLLPAHAQFGGPKVAMVTATSKPASVAPGGRGFLLVTVTVGPQYHINAHVPNDPAYIATAFAGRKTPGITYGSPVYPTPRAMKLFYAPKPLLVYTGRVVVAVPYTVAKTAKPGKTALAGALSFQGCDTKSCYPPASAQVRAAVMVK